MKDFRSMKSIMISQLSLKRNLKSKSKLFPELNSKKSKCLLTMSKRQTRNKIGRTKMKIKKTIKMKVNGNLKSRFKRKMMRNSVR